VTNPNDNATWLPNLVGGVSIWKLAVDLNEPKFFDGRLLVPETEGSDSLPVTVRWDVTGLVPYAQAVAQHPEAVAVAVKEFQAALERVAKVFATPNSGFDKYKQAFTVPSLEAGGGASYYYSPEKKKLFVTNWGASPRSMGGRAEYVFGYEDWGKVFPEKAAAAFPGSAAVATAPSSAPDVVKAAEATDEAAKAKEAEKKKTDESKKRPWWLWPLFAVLAIALVLLALFLLRACDDTRAGADAAADAMGEAGADGAAADGGDDGALATGAPDAAEGGASIGDAGDGGATGEHADGGKDGGRDASSDGGTASNDDDGDDGNDEPGGGGGGGGGAGGGAGGGKVIVTMGGAGGGDAPTAKTGPHRRHYQADAQQWRIKAGNDRVSRTEQRGQRFDVWLGPGRTFQGVTVEWQDKAGKWHVH